MSLGLNAELLLDDVVCAHGEGVVWNARRNELAWVDLIVGDIHRILPDGNHSCTPLGQSVGAIAPTDESSYVVASADGFFIVDLDGPGSALTPLATGVITLDGLRMNDGSCDSAGRFWAGSMVTDGLPHRAGLYRVDGRGNVVQLLKRVDVSNGIGWAPEDDRCYYIDSGSGRVDEFSYTPDDGCITNRRTLAEVDSNLGVPDGLTVDVDGGIWVAIWGGGRIHRYSPRGELDRVLTLPVSQVSSCAFGGPDLRDLFVTTSQLELDPVTLASQPHAGKTFVFDVGTSGLPANEFALQ